MLYGEKKRERNPTEKNVATMVIVILSVFIFALPSAWLFHLLNCFSKKWKRFKQKAFLHFVDEFLRFQLTTWFTGSVHSAYLVENAGVAEYNHRQRKNAKKEEAEGVICHLVFWWLKSVERDTLVVPTKMWMGLNMENNCLEIVLKN